MGNEYTRYTGKIKIIKDSVKLFLFKCVDNLKNKQLQIFKL